MPRQSIADKRRVPGVRLVTHQMRRLCQVGSAHILPTSGAGAHHTLPPTAHHTTPLLVSGHYCTRKPRLLNDQIIREIPIPLLSLNECVSKYSLVMNEFTCSPKSVNEGRLLRTYKQNMIHILSHIQTSALNQSRYFVEILDQLTSF